MGYVVIYQSAYICPLASMKGTKLVEYANYGKVNPAATWIWTVSLKKSNAAIFDSISDAEKFLNYCNGEENGYSLFPKKKCKIVDFDRAPAEL